MQWFAMRQLRALSLAAVLALALGACGTEGDSTTSTAPTPATTTQTFSGTIDQLGSAVHSFTVSATGTVTIGLTSVGPLATMALGVGMGAWDGVNCGTSIAQNENARAGSAALTGTATAGNYCVRVYDSGNIPEGWSVSYTVQVAHP